jgi:cytochrome c oxidase subunit 2
VRVVSQQEYDEWVTQQATFLNDDLRKAFKMPVVEAATEPAPAAAADSVKKDTAAVTTNQIASKN